jgi:hypothetical protein
VRVPVTTIGVVGRITVTVLGVVLVFVIPQRGRDSTGRAHSYPTASL